jgi:hypothetical protein
MRWPMRDARLWDGFCEMHAYEIAPVRAMPMRDMPIKCPSIGDVYLGSTFNQSVQIAFTIWEPQIASLLVGYIFHRYVALTGIQLS